MRVSRGKIVAITVVAREGVSPKLKCPVCKSEVSRKWRTSNSSKVPSASQAQWVCSVCGGTFVRAELQALSKHVLKNE
jgi:transposase-like protein